MNYLVAGAGKSGNAVNNYLKSNNASVFVYDDSFIKIKNYNNFVKNFNVCITSPAFAPDHPLLVACKKNCVNIISEVEFASYLIDKSNKLIGVTGTNGKTTVVTMINYVINDESVLCGNIGYPITEKVVNVYKKTIVAELSSFQLNYIKKFKPDIACVLNLKPDHLAYHKTISNYYNAKLNIFKNVTQNDYAVLNIEDDLLIKLTKKIKANKYYFGINNTKNGTFIKHKSVYFRNNNTIEFVYKIKNYNNVFEHNILNILASVCILKLIGITNNKIEKLNNYQYQPFRLAYVGKINNCKVFNDSKSTNVASLISALNCFKSKQVVCLIGGIDKQEDFKKVFIQNNLSTVILYGKSANVILTQAKLCNYKNVYMANDFEQAIKMGVEYSKNKDILLFSPACASLDMFNGYEHRGEEFDKIISKYLTK